LEDSDPEIMGKVLQQKRLFNPQLISGKQQVVQIGPVTLFEM
jgi:hypothetical protein